MNEYMTYYQESAIEEGISQVATQRIKSIAFWVILATSGAIAYYYHLAGYSMAAAAIICTVLGITMLIAPHVSFYVYFAWQALDPIFITTEETIFTPAKALALFILLVYAMSYGRIRQRILVSKPIIIVMLLFGFISVLGAPIVAILRLRALKDSLQIVVQAAMIFAALHFLDNKKRVNSALFWCSVSGVLAGIAMLITGGVSGQSTRGTLGEFANPNTTALAFSVSLMALVGLWGLKKSKISWLFYLLSGGLILLSILKTGNRSYLAGLPVALVLGVMLGRGVKMIVRIFIPVLLSVILVGSIFYVLSLRVLDEKSQQRLEAVTSGRIEAGARGTGGDRLAIWQRTVSAYSENKPIFGWGSNNSIAAMQIYRGEKMDIHSSMLGTLVDTGPIGFLLFHFGLLLLFIKIRGISNPRMNVAATIMFIFLISAMFVHTIHFAKWFWILVTMCLLLSEQSKREETEGFPQMELSTETPFSHDDYNEPPQYTEEYVSY